jgi:hypothetical protein
MMIMRMIDSSKQNGTNVDVRRHMYKQHRHHQPAPSNKVIIIQ